MQQEVLPATIADSSRRILADVVSRRGSARASLTAMRDRRISLGMCGRRSFHGEAAKLCLRKFPPGAESRPSQQRLLNVMQWRDAYKSCMLADVVWKGESRITRLFQPNPIWRAIIPIALRLAVMWRRVSDTAPNGTPPKRCAQAKGGHRQPTQRLDRQELLCGSGIVRHKPASWIIRQGASTGNCNSGHAKLSANNGRSCNTLTRAGSRTVFGGSEPGASAKRGECRARGHRYPATFRGELAKPNMSEEDIREVLWDSLPPSVVDKLVVMDNSSLQAMQANLKHIDEGILKYKQDIHNHTQPDTVKPACRVRCRLDRNPEFADILSLDCATSPHQASSRAVKRDDPLVTSLLDSLDDEESGPALQPLLLSMPSLGLTQSPLASRAIAAASLASRATPALPVATRAYTAMLKTTYTAASGIETTYSATFGVEDNCTTASSIESIYSNAFDLESTFSSTFEVENDYSTAIGIESNCSTVSSIKSTYIDAFDVESTYSSAFDTTYSGVFDVESDCRAPSGIETTYSAVSVVESDYSNTPGSESSYSFELGSSQFNNNHQIRKAGNSNEPTPKNIGEIDSRDITCCKTFPVNEGVASQTAIMSSFGNPVMFTRKKIKIQVVKNNTSFPTHHTSVQHWTSDSEHRSSIYTPSPTYQHISTKPDLQGTAEINNGGYQRNNIGPNSTPLKGDTQQRSSVSAIRREKLTVWKHRVPEPAAERCSCKQRHRPISGHYPLLVEGVRAPQWRQKMTITPTTPRAESIWTRREERCLYYEPSSKQETNFSLLANVKDGLGLAKEGKKIDGRNTGHKANRLRFLAGTLPDFLYVGIVTDDAAGRRIFSGISRFPRPLISTLLHTNLDSHSSALKASTLKVLCTGTFSVKKSLFALQRYDGITARIARRSDEALGVRVTVARIVPSLLDLGRTATESP
ncbi:hypothetical protein PR048_008293 [Dryococelus australis]|uniref:Uncharacterized protein n=1 Tax=Dryococelus australis TaxID=614101 RepID=A0ABQ9HXH8_9NEOP|nr:hypothetical protein PR048_008293 [Dryococelus australis]